MNLARAFSEVNFEPSFLFEDGRTRNEIFRELKSQDYQFIEQDDKKILIFVNAKNKVNIQIFHDKVVLDITEPNDINKIKTVATSVIPYIINRLDAGKTTRIGIRVYYVNDEISGLTESSDFIAKNFFDLKLTQFIESHENEEDTAPKISFQIKLNHETALLVNIGYFQRFKSGSINSRGEISNYEIETTNPLIDLDVFTITPKDSSQLNGVYTAYLAYLKSYFYKILSKEK